MAMLCVLQLLVGQDWRNHFKSGEGGRQASKIIAAHIPHLPFTSHTSEGDAKEMVIFTKGWFTLNFKVLENFLFCKNHHLHPTLPSMVFNTAQ